MTLTSRGKYAKHGLCNMQDQRGLGQGRKDIRLLRLGVLRGQFGVSSSQIDMTKFHRLPPSLQKRWRCDRRSTWRGLLGFNYSRSSPTIQRSSELSPATASLKKSSASSLTSARSPLTLQQSCFTSLDRKM